MTVVLPIEAAQPGERTRIWRRHLIALGGVAAVILLLFRGDSTDIVTIWLTNTTFNHCALIAPLIGWLVWQRVPELKSLAPTAWAPGLALVAFGALAWLLGEAGSLALARHTGLVLMLQGAVIACLGKSVARGLAFPIFYALFLIPAGEELVPLLQTVTAQMTMGLLGVTGIPAHMDGVFISTPTGYFEVAEACSGVRFLVAMLAYGALVASVCFRAWPRRVGFIAACVVIPVLANGVRAWGTIYVAHLTSVDFAAGFDHILWGWIFFAIVIALTIAAGWPFFDRKPDDPWFDPGALQPDASAAGSRAGLGRTVAAALALAALAPFWSQAVASTSGSTIAATSLPQVPGWQRVPVSGRSWRPHFAGADALRIGRYRNSAGQEVDLAVAVYARQGNGKELVGYGQGAAGPDSTWAWAADEAAPPDGKAERIASQGEVREVVSFYRVGRRLTGSAAEVKLETIKARLLGDPQRAVAVLVSAPAPAAGVSARPAIEAFLHDIGSVAALADAQAGYDASAK